MKSNTKNLTEKLRAICELPFVFISYPVLEDTVSLFNYDPKNNPTKKQIFELVPELRILELKLVPSSMSLNKFTYILLMLCTDYLPLQSHLDDTLSTQSTLPEKTLSEPSPFIKDLMAEMRISSDQYSKLSENLQLAFEIAERDMPDDEFTD